jgi:hypothetical protein
MHRTIRCTTAIVLAAAGLAQVSGSSARTRVAPPEADAHASMPRVAPPQADAAAEGARHLRAVAAPVIAAAPASPQPNDGFDYGDGAVGAATTAAAIGLALIGLAARRDPGARALLRMRGAR